MTQFSQQQVRAYLVTVQFFSATNLFAQEIYPITAIDEAEAERLGRLEAEKSVYNDDRVPDLRLEVGIGEDDPPEPEDDPPTPAPARLSPRCPNCGSADLLKDACARWDDYQQCWSLAGTHDCETCDHCGAEGDDIAIWVPAEAIAASDHFLWAVLEILQRRDLATDSRFQEFCLSLHDQLTAEQAAEEWRARDLP